MTDLHDALARDLAELEERDSEINQLRSALQSQAWSETIFPLIHERKLQALERLISMCCEGADADKIRAKGTEVAALNYVGQILSKRVAEHDRTRAELLKQLADLDQLDVRNQRVVDSGRGNPYRQVQDDPTDMEP